MRDFLELENSLVRGEYEGRRPLMSRRMQRLSSEEAYCASACCPRTSQIVRDTLISLFDDTRTTKASAIKPRRKFSFRFSAFHTNFIPLPSD